MGYWWKISCKEIWPKLSYLQKEECSFQFTSYVSTAGERSDLLSALLPCIRRFIWGDQGQGKKKSS